MAEQSSTCSGGGERAWSTEGVTHSSRAGAERLWEESRDETGKGVRPQIVMDFVSLLKSLRFHCITGEEQLKDF